MAHAPAPLDLRAIGEFCNTAVLLQGTDELDSLARARTWLRKGGWEAVGGQLELHTLRNERESFRASMAGRDALGRRGYLPDSVGAAVDEAAGVFAEWRFWPELRQGAAGSDCGIVDVNLGTSGAEIDDAFGDERDTGAGRESESESWKVYVCRATNNTVNFSGDFPVTEYVTVEI